MKKILLSLCATFMMVLISCSDKDKLPEIVKPVDIEMAFPDPIFRSYVLKNFDIDNNGVISKEEAEKVTIIDVSNRYDTPDSEKIKSLQGIEYFTALTELYCSFNELTTLDVSKNTALTFLGCYDNQLKTLDVNGCTALDELDCDNNQLKTLDVSGCTALLWLDCFENQLTTLDVSGCTALKELSCEYNELTTLDVSKNTALTYLDCEGNKLTTLDVSKTNLGNSTYAPALSCNMTSLNTLILKKGWKIDGIYPYRYSDYINDNTQIEFVD